MVSQSSPDGQQTMVVFPARTSQVAPEVQQKLLGRLLPEHAEYPEAQSDVRGRRKPYS